MARDGGGGVVQMLLRVARDVLEAALKPSRGTSRETTRTARTPRPAPGTAPAPDGYAGDATDVPALRYEPFPDDDADPGEIVWAWVPYEEDHSRGKDRPVLVIGRRGGLLLALMLTSQDHDRDAADEARYGRHWVDIGAGAWDPQRRPSEVRVDRVLQLDPGAVRRAGAALDRDRFEDVAAAVRKHRRG
jgi:PemK-like, MazF-like toxin of type II toxin-antitoxin system